MDNHTEDCCPPARPAERVAAAPERGTTAFSLATGVGSILTAFVASACCVGPLIFALLGLGGAGLLVAFEPYRPVFMTMTFLLLGAGFYFAYRPRSAALVDAPSAGDDAACDCPAPRTNRAGRVMLWVAAALVLLFFAAPYVLPMLVG